jgi:hypothetical protein
MIPKGAQGKDGENRPGLTAMMADLSRTARRLEPRPRVEGAQTNIGQEIGIQMMRDIYKQQGAIKLPL